MLEKFKKNIWLFFSIFMLVSGFLGLFKLTFVKDLTDTERITTMISTAFDILMVLVMIILDGVNRLTEYYSRLLDIFIKVLSSENEKQEIKEVDSSENKDESSSKCNL